MEEDIVGREDLITEVLNRLDHFGSLVADGATAGFEILVRQAVVDGVLSLVWASFTLAIFIIVVVIGYKMIRGDYGELQDSFGSPMHIVFGPMMLVASIIPFVVFAGHLGNGIRRLVNPGYYAIEYILKQIG